MEHLDQLRLHPFGPVAIRLVDDEDVGDLEEAGLHHLDRVARLGHEDDDRRVSEPHDVELRLAHADRLDDHVLHPEGVEQAGHVTRRPRDAAVAAAAGEAPDEDSRVEEVGLHPDAVAQHGPTAEGARRVDGHDPDARARGAEMPRDAVGERRLPRPGGPGDADHVRPSAPGVDPAHQRGKTRGAVLDQRHEPRERHAVARLHALDEPFDLGLTHRSAPSENSCIFTHQVQILAPDYHTSGLDRMWGAADDPAMAAASGLNVVTFARNGLVLAGLLLLALGFGDALAGRAKVAQYEELLETAAVQEPSDPAALFPTASEGQEREALARAKLAFYQLLLTSGQLLSALGFALFAFGVIRMLRQAPDSSASPPLAN